MSTVPGEPADPLEPVDAGTGADRADLDGADLDGADLDGADSDGADLDGADFDRPDLDRPELDGDDEGESVIFEDSDPDEDDSDDVPLGTPHNVYSLADPTRHQLGIEEATSAIARGALVVLPTDTVYGLGADAFDPAGVRRLLRAKGRGRRMPTPVLIGSRDTLRALAANLGSEARDLADAFWPGGLTLICRQQPSLRWDLGDSRGTVALRMPDHEDALELLRATGPLAVSSANTTGEPSATTVEQALEMLGDSVDVYLDGGAVNEIGIASTIVDATGDRMRLVRRGKVTVEALLEVVPSLEAPEPG